jgi:2-oxo-4-hydroxy-4-carboxy--5-ureidoimidazoline (OHCU) decarboxylase
MAPLTDRKRRIILMSLAYMHKYGEPFVELVKGGTREQNMQAWETLRGEIKELHAELVQKFNQS